MSGPSVLDRWSADRVRLPDVLQAVSSLRDGSGGPHTSARTAVMTLVAVAPSDEQAYEATGALRALAGHHPARIILLRPDPDRAASLAARATLYGHQRVNFEEIALDVGGQAARHLDSLVEAFTLSDLPVAVWYVGSIPDPSDPLLSVATALLVDSRDAPDVAQMRSLLHLARRRTVVDLSWKRLGPWRELLSGLFDPPSTRGCLESLDQAEVSGKSGPRRLLGGWLVAQTVLAPKHVSVRDARHVSVRLTAATPDGQASFRVERPDGQRLVAAEATLPGGRAVRATIELPDDPLTTSLAAALTQMSPDPVWERALSAATSLVDA